MAYRWLILGLAIISFGEEAPLAPLSLDDECNAEQGACALNALHLKASIKTASIAGDPEKEGSNWNTAREEEKGLCGDCMMNNHMGVDADHVGGTLVRASNCWTACNKQAGNCEGFCGKSNACCRYGFPGPAECNGVAFWPTMSYHTCVPSSDPITNSDPSADGTGSLSLPASTAAQHAHNTYYLPKLQSLRTPSDAPLYTFYVYRAMSDDSFPPENVNAANAAGVMWYLHNEVVVYTPRKFKITRIVRFKVQYKAPQPLYQQGMSFGVRYAFDSGRCTGPGDCVKDFDTYGYFVGCNYVWQYPTAQFSDAVYYPNATWYSFPGPCNDKDYKSHTRSCVRTNPGGACPGSPTGQGDCTYTYEPAGEIRIDDMVNITNYGAFMASGGREYIRCRPSQMSNCDKGVNAKFWNWKKSPRINQWRVDQLLGMFREKYPDSPSYDNVPCDFNQAVFSR